MLSYCLKCKKGRKSVESKILKTKNGRTIISLKCVAGDNKKSRFVKEQDAKDLLSSLGLKTPLSKVPLLGDTFCLNYKID